MASQFKTTSIKKTNKQTNKQIRVDEQEQLKNDSSGRYMDT